METQGLLLFARNLQLLLWNELIKTGGNYMTVVIGIVLLAAGIALILKGND